MELAPLGTMTCTMGQSVFAFLLAFLLGACASQEKPPPKVEMVAMDPLPSATLAAPTPEAGPVVGDAGRDPHDRDIIVGKIVTLPAEGVRNFSVAGPNIDVRPTPDGKKFVIAGKSSGRVDLLLIHKDGSQEIFTFHVYDP